MGILNRFMSGSYLAKIASGRNLFSVETDSKGVCFRLYLFYRAVFFDRALQFKKNHEGSDTTAMETTQAASAPGPGPIWGKVHAAMSA